MPLLSESEIHRMRADESLLRRELEAGGAVFRGRVCRCIFHDDRTPSAGIYGKDGVWKFKCQGCQVGGDIFDIRAALNKSTVEEELQKEAMKHAPLPPAERAETFPTLDAILARFRTTEAVYNYTNPATGGVDMAVIRWRGEDGKKRFTQASPAPGGQWWMKAPAIRPIYNRRRVAKAESVVVVEGEKCVHALHDIGIVATTSPQGAKSGDKADWKPLAGKIVYLWADNDESGIFYRDTVRAILIGLGCTVFIVAHETLELPEGGDAADFVDRYGTDKALAADAVQDILADARPVGVFGDYVKETEEIIAGKRRAIPFRWKGLSNYSRALMPGTVTCLFGPPGATKSFLITDNLAYWIGEGIKCGVYMLEDNRNFHLRRIHAQIHGDARLTDNDFVESNGAFVRESMEHFRENLEAIGKSIWDAPDEEVSFEMLETWVEERAKAGYEILVIDPITAAQTNQKPWIADQKFIFKIKTIVRRYSTRLILVTHPRKSQKPVAVGLDDMAGGAAYQRFTHTVLIVEKNEEEVPVRESIHEACPVLREPNRIIRIAKARNGPGAGKRIAYEFDSDTLRFREMGLIEKATV